MAPDLEVLSLKLPIMGFLPWGWLGVAEAIVVSLPALLGVVVAAVVVLVFAAVVVLVFAASEDPWFDSRSSE